MADFPDVPDEPGVPPLVRDPFSDAISSLVLLAADVLSVLAFFGTNQWGLYQNGFPVIVADSVLAVDYKQHWSLSSYPIEDGGFETYDKVELPFESTIRFVAGGATAAHTELLDSIAAIAGNLEQYDVVTPDAVYLSCNVENYDYRRQDGRVGLLIVDVHVKEVRINSQTQFTDTKNPSGSNTVDGGTVQTSDATSAQTSEVNSSFGASQPTDI